MIVTDDDLLGVLQDMKEGRFSNDQLITVTQAVIDDRGPVIRFSDRLAEFHGDLRIVQSKVEGLTTQVADLGTTVTRVSADVLSLRADMSRRFEGVNRRFEGMDRRLEGM